MAYFVIDFLNQTETKLTEDEISILFEKSRGGDHEARKRLTLHYLPLVNVHVRRFIDRGVSYDDLFQEACFGLIDAIDHFDPHYGTSFFTFSSFYVKKYLRKAMISQNIYTPIVYKETFYYEAMRYFRAVHLLKDKLGRQPTDDELAEELKSTAKKVQKVRQHVYTFCSCQSLKGDYEDPAVFFSDDRKEKSAESEALGKMSCLDFSPFHIHLTEREEEIFCRHFGFTKEGTPQGLREISIDMGLSYETIRSTYAGAIARIQKRMHNSNF